MASTISVILLEAFSAYDRHVFLSCECNQKLIAATTCSFYFYTHSTVITSFLPCLLVGNGEKNTGKRFSFCCLVIKKEGDMK